MSVKIVQNTPTAVSSIEPGTFFTGDITSKMSAVPLDQSRGVSCNLYLKYENGFILLAAPENNWDDTNGIFSVSNFKTVDVEIKVL